MRDLSSAETHRHDVQCVTCGMDTRVYTAMHTHHAQQGTINEVN